MNLLHTFFPVCLVTISLCLFQACASDSSRTSESEKTTKTHGEKNHTLYKGSISQPGLDSIYNELYLYKNETFRLEQVDRLGEHHLDEKITNGLYSYLKGGDQLGLFLSSGTLILRFAVKDDGLYIMDLDGESIKETKHVWKNYTE